MSKYIYTHICIKLGEFTFLSKNFYFGELGIWDSLSTRRTSDYFKKEIGRNEFINQLMSSDNLICWLEGFQDHFK